MKSKTKRALLGLGVTAMVVTPITTVVACGEENTDIENANNEITTTLNLTETELQVLVSFTGTNGSGSVSIDNSATGYTVALADETQDGSFSNDDVVTFTVTAEAGYELGTTPEIFTVNVFGLDEVVDITKTELQALVSFTGYDGSGTVEIDDSDMVGYTITYDIALDGTLSNDETVKFTVSATNGWILSESTPTTFEVTVSGLVVLSPEEENLVAELQQIVDQNSYGTFVDEEEVLEIIKNITGEKTLTAEDLLFTGNDAKGTLTLTILDFYEEEDDLTITLFGFKQYESNNTIPDEAYKEETLPTWFTIPETVTTIGDYAFYGATFLGDFILPDSVTSIGDYTFSRASFLGEFTLANTQVETIGNDAFSSMELPATFALPDSVTTIGDYAFCETNFLGDFTLANTQVETIGQEVFLAATFSGDCDLPDSLKTIGGAAFGGATFLGEFTLANTQVETIGNSAFSSVELPATFALPDSLTTIGGDAFSYATFLGEFTLANTQVETIGNGAFNSVELPATFALPDSLTTIVDYAFYGATFLGDFILPDSVTSIGNKAFEGATLPDGFAIPENVTIGTDAFKDVQMAENLTWYDENGVDQGQDATPGPGWYIAPKS